jgi:hypothetical protein
LISGRAQEDVEAYDIFFSLRLEESENEAKELKAMIERTRPGVRCFLSGRNPNGTMLPIIISTALCNAKMAIIMGSKTYGRRTTNVCSTFQEMHHILSENKPMFLLKMCEEWEEYQTRLMMGSIHKFSRWDGQVTRALVDEILTSYDQATRPGQASVASQIGTPIDRSQPHNDTDTFHERETRSGEAGYEHGADTHALPPGPDREESAA